MTAIEAMIYCLGFIEDTPGEDGECHSQTVYDKDGEPHWFSFDEEQDHPELCSGSCEAPFAKCLEPYSVSKKGKRSDP